MRSFDPDIVTALAAVEARAFWLVEMQMDTTYYFTDCDVDLVYAGNVYQSDQGLKVSNVRQGAGFSVDKVGIEFGNAALWMSAIVLAEDVAMDPVIIRYIMYSKEVAVRAGGDTPTGGVAFEDGDVVWEDGEVTFEGGGEYYSLIGTPPVFFNGYITGYKLNERVATFTLSTEFMLWRKKALRLPTPSCPWSFTGTECAYAGAETWCDQSPERCALLGNYDNFGGRKYIAAVEDQKLWWGVKGYGTPS